VPGDIVFQPLITLLIFLLDALKELGSGVLLIKIEILPQILLMLFYNLISD